MTTPLRLPCAAVDVAMIVHDEAKILGATLDALLAAGFDRFVILDMESSDGTAALVRDRLGERATLRSMPRASLLRAGYAEARNTCAAFCRREWVLFVDADEVLQGGVAEGAIVVDAEGANPALYSIRRINRLRDGESAAVHSVETHNRLYRPLGWQKWAGYIHEEIRAETVGPDDAPAQGGATALVFDHRLDVKPEAAEAKAGLYALMLIRAANQKALRHGTNPWHYEDYVPAHRALLEERAARFARSQGIDATFYGPIEEIGGIGEAMRRQAPRTFAADDAAEVALPLAGLRTLHSMPSSPWTGTPGRALWGEWDHPGEASRTLTALIEGARACHWERFVRPGAVAIDVGAHSGDTAIPMALFAYDRDAGRKGDVVVVEPNPAVAPILAANLAMNTHLATFHTLAVAITAADTPAIELADHGNAECNGGVLAAPLSSALSEHLRTIAGVRYTVPGIALATLFATVECLVPDTPIGFVKIDCEGYDKEILRPCRALLARTKPTLFVEWFAWFAPEDDADLFAVIEAIDYVPLDPTTLARADAGRRIADLLCIHKTRLDEI